MELAVLGAGCSGSSLAYSLVNAGFDGEIHIFDSRTDFSREQRWCSWGPVPSWVEGLVSASWERWTIVSGGETVLNSLPERPYLHVHAPEFYRSVHGWLRQHPKVHFHLGDAVRSVDNGGDGSRPEVETATGKFEVDFVFDSRMSPLKDMEGRGDEVRLHQSFAGVVVKSERPVFDPRTVTLMDFGSDVATGVTTELSFVYVLPFSRDRALVESTAFSERVVPDKEHRATVERYLDRLGTGGYSVESRESGDIPMTTDRFPSRKGRRHVMIGAAGGATRPSSGYAFVHILRQSEMLAEAIVKGGGIPGRPVPRKYDALDAIFLEALRSSPSLARESFVRMFGRVPPDSLVRFLSSESTSLDDARVMLSLPKQPFLHAAVRRAKALAGKPG